MKIVTICNPENRRASFFREACLSLGLSPPTELAWLDYLNGGSVNFSNYDLIRVESPGENFEVEKRLIELGGGPVDLEFDLGRIHFQSEWYQGWQTTLDRLADSAGNTTFFNPPESIALMFDKWRSQRHLESQQVTVPRLLGMVEDFDHFVATLESSSVKRAFLKPIHSSSASGVVAFQMANRDKMLAVTSTELVCEDGIRLYNSLRLRRYQDEPSIRQLVNALASQNLMAEVWFPKASLKSRTYDLRVLVIGGKASHVVVRTSRSPITNLHLGNARGDVNEVRQSLGETIWYRGMKRCEIAASTFPSCHYVAVDLMVSSSKTDFAVAEVNAFGDLIPNILNQIGDNTYTAEIRALM